jgi:superfamily I DNA/RNA helicase
MTEFSPNNEQQKLIDSHEGIYKVDAGAGTGKTFTVTRRYAKILKEKSVGPEDLLLLTFTNNAAEEMKERIINNCDYSMKALREAPISTFHSLCKKIINEQGFEIPQLLGLIKALAAKGIVPEEEGWYRNTEEYLDGDFEEYWELVKEKNTPNGNGQSELRGRTASVFNKCLEKDAPSEEDVRGQPYVDKQINEEYARKAFEEDRENLKQFVHDIYFEYIQYCLSRNYLNFNFLLVFAFVLLNEDDSIREEMKFDYTMIDEFQDTNEIQLKIAMLLSKGNICAVGDWKQSIYSFQYADVDNIRKFSKRLERYKEELNDDKERISYSVGNVEPINLKQNYRSTQDILDFSENSLILPGKEDETLDEDGIKEDITSLEANTSEQSKIKALTSEDEVKAVLHNIQNVVENPDYAVDGETTSYKDIAVLTRNRNFGLELHEKAREHNIPVAYDGGVELFTTKPAILLLAWLRILNYKESKKGWAVILEKAGYNFDEIKQITDNKKYSETGYPENMLEFLRELEDEKYVSAIAQKIFERYGINNGFSDKVTEVIQKTFDSSYKNTGELIRFIEESIEDGATYEVDNSTKQNSVTVQTIHSAKGLEYPIVFVADINKRHFPSNQGSSSRITYSDVTGLRQKKLYNSDEKYCFDNWKAHLSSKVLSGDYDEERRLMYVAMTRAEQHLFFTAETDNESPFFENLELETEQVAPELEHGVSQEENLNELEVEESNEKAPVKRSVHAIMELEEDTEGRGAEFGTKVHEFAEKYANDGDVEPENEDEENVKQFIDSLEGELKTEIPVKVPVEENGRKIVYHGVIDLLHLNDDKVEIIDWKTDLTKVNESEYQKQLGVYKKGISRIFDLEVSKKIFYTDDSFSVNRP